MNLNQEIEEKARAYAQKLYVEYVDDYAHEKEGINYTLTSVGSDFEGFINGAKYMLSLLQYPERWRDVQKELPEDDKSLLVDTTQRTIKGMMDKVGVIKTKPVLVKYKDGTIIIACRCQSKGDNYYWWDCIESFDKNSNDYIIAWKPIESQIMKEQI